MRKLGQEEIVGFIVVVVLVALIGVGFLGFMFAHQEPTVITSSTEVHQLLQSMLSYTGNCSISSEGYDRDLGRNLATCAADSTSVCVSGDLVCDSVNQSIRQLLGSAYLIKNGSATTGYVFSAAYGNASDAFLNISSGSCPGSFKADEVPLPYSTFSTTGTIRIELKICSA